MVAVYLRRPDDFSAFPAIILIATTFRLAVSVSTTRMILSEADAGQIVETFGNFVTQGSVIVGMVIFLIITTVQFIVITKGSERVAEVAARFTLDALPGRQMSIDSELRAGDITSEEASKRRKRLEKENQFFGAMDGAMKFVKGDAIAGLVIIAINLLGGITIGILNENLSAGEAGQVYSLLTIGDGLVSQLPALIMAICAGTVITRVTTDRENDLGTDISEQLVGHPKSLIVGSGIIGIIGFIPGFPTMLFLAMSAVLGLGAYIAIRTAKEKQDSEDFERENVAKGLPSAPEERVSTIDVSADDVFKITLGADIYNEFGRDEFVVEREQALLRGFKKTGIKQPVFGVELDPTLDPYAMIISLDNVPVFNAEIPAGVSVVICDSDVLQLSEVSYVAVEDHWPLRSAFWVDSSDNHSLEELGAEIIPVGTLIARLGGHLLASKSSKILGYKIVQDIIRDLAKEHEQLASQVSQSLSPVQLLNVLRLLLDDGVPLLPRRILFEALLEGTLSGGSAPQLAERARMALSRQICSNFADENRVIATYIVEPNVEEAIRDNINFGEEDNNFYPNSQLSDCLLREVAERRHIEEINASPPVILTQAELRRPLSQYLKQHNLAFNVMAMQELSSEFNANPIGTIGSTYEHSGDNDNDFVNAA
jgi:type III secretion protein V